MEAFHTAVEMHQRGIRPVEIWENLHRNGFQIKYDTVLSWINGERDPTRKLNIVHDWGGNLVELIGLVSGDGSTSKIMKGKSYFSGRIGYASIDRELSLRVGVLMAKVLGRKKPYRPYWSEATGVFLVESRSKELCEIIQGGLASLRSLILDYPRRFLRGIYDAEGCPSIKTKSRRLYPRVLLTNSDPEILELTKNLLRKLGIATTMELNTKAGKRKRIKGKDTLTRRDVFNICIGRFAMVRKFARMIGFRIPAKQRILQEVVRAISEYGTDGAFVRISLPSPG
jgi:intein-encoded DNA endonuclease-like protein